MSDRTIGKKTSRSSRSSSSSSLSRSSSSSPSPDKSPNHKKHKDSEDCSICFKEMKKGQKITTLGCTHKFHDECINEWINGQRRVHLDPTCPNCRAIIPPPPPPPPPPRRDLIGEDIDIVDEYEAEHDGDSMPFLGVIVLYNGIQLTHLNTYLNTDLNLTLQSTISDLKNAILAESGNFAAKCSLFSQPGVVIPAYNLLSQQPLEPSFDIEKMYFGTPAGIKYPKSIIHESGGLRSDIHSTIQYDKYRNIVNYNSVEHNDDSLENVYISYRKKANKILEIMPDAGYATIKHFKSLKVNPLADVFNQYISGAKNGQDIKVNYYYNHVNPDIPEDHRPQKKYTNTDDNASLETENILKKSTKIPLAWMIVEVGCHLTLSGGKTRRNKLRKQNKSRRRTQTTR